jgi:hypothetical protein
MSSPFDGTTPTPTESTESTVSPSATQQPGGASGSWSWTSNSLGDIGSQFLEGAAPILRIGQFLDYKINPYKDNATNNTGYTNPYGTDDPGSLGIRIGGDALATAGNLMGGPEAALMKAGLSGLTNVAINTPLVQAGVQAISKIGSWVNSVIPTTKNAPTTGPDPLAGPLAGLRPIGSDIVYKVEPWMNNYGVPLASAALQVPGVWKGVESMLPQNQNITNFLKNNPDAAVNAGKFPNSMPIPIPGNPLSFESQMKGAGFQPLPNYISNAGETLHDAISDARNSAKEGYDQMLTQVGSIPVDPDVKTQLFNDLNGLTNITPNKMLPSDKAFSDDVTDLQGTINNFSSDPTDPLTVGNLINIRQDWNKANFIDQTTGQWSKPYDTANVSDALKDAIESNLQGKDETSWVNANKNYSDMKSAEEELSSVDRNPEAFNNQPATSDSRQALANILTPQELQDYFKTAAIKAGTTVANPGIDYSKMLNNYLGRIANWSYTNAKAVNGIPGGSYWNTGVFDKQAINALPNATNPGFYKAALYGQTVQDITNPNPNAKAPFDLMTGGHDYNNITSFLQNQ